MLDFIRQTVYALRQQYGCTIVLNKTIVGQPDYEAGKSATSIQSLPVAAIAMPYDLSKSMFKSSIITYAKNTRRFIVDTSQCDPSWTIEGTFIIYNGVRYNIKESSKMENLYYDVIATSAGDEPHE